MCLLTSYISGLEKCPFKFFPKNWVIFLLLILRVLYLFWILDPYQIYDLQKVSPVLWLVYYLLDNAL